jgi:prepilin-type N-terminal cleavage/methylation domain-containing protein
MNKKGFTLIELLIVIAILGILATALLAGIDPLEQFNKAKDSGRFSKLREMYGASQRRSLNDVQLPTSSNGALSSLTADPTILTTLQGEIKASITTNTADMAAMYYGAISDPTEGIKFAFCYKPIANANKKVANIASTALITTAGTMATTTAGSGDLICIY